MKPTTRRKFMKAAGLSAVAAAGGPALAQEEPRPARSQSESLAEIVRVRFGQHLSEAELKSIQQRLGRQLATAEQMKRTRLTNGDEPAFVFVPEE
jgi:hypothetical protein